MRKSMLPKLALALTLMALLLTGCASPQPEEVTEENPPETSDAAPVEATTVEITDIHGTVTVPVNPEKVIALDNRTFETLSDWDIQLVAAPKAVMPASSPYVADESVQDIGNHREPNLEIIAAADPDIVIVGQRFASHYEEIKALVPNAAVIDLNFDVSEAAATPGDNLVNGLKNSTTVLGQIFDRNEEAEQLNADFDAAIAAVQAAYSGTDTVMSVVVSGGNIGFSAPLSGRVWGPMYEVFGWEPALDLSKTSSDHQGDEISVEAIAQSNPDWIFVLDRDAATSAAGEFTPAQDVIENSPALQNITAVTDGNVLYAPADTYTNESIQTYLKLFEDIAAALAKE